VEEPAQIDIAAPGVQTGLDDGRVEPVGRGGDADVVTLEDLDEALP